MDSIKQAMGLQDCSCLTRYDIGGEGTCMKRYSDPAFFKTDSACSRMLQEGMRTERRPIRTMEIRPNLQNAEIFRASDGANNDSRFKTDLSGEVLDEVPTRRQRLKHRQLNGTVFRSFRPQMQDLYEKASPEEKTFSMDRSEVQISFTDSPDTNVEERDIMVDTSSTTEKGKEGYYATARKRRSTSQETPSSCSAGSSKGYSSEVDIYVDTLTTMGSDSEHRDHGGQGAFALGKMCSDAQGAAVSRSSTFSKKEDSCSSDVGSGNRDEADHSEGDVTVCVTEAKLVGGEHERTSSLEELFSQEKPVSCEHERTVSLEELLTGDILLSEPDTRELATESSGNAIVSNATSDGTADATKRAKGNNVSAISFKKTASKRCVESMELFASKVGILPRKLSKKHDPFSDSLRNMAKELLELKCDGTQDTDLYEFEANGDGFDVKCRKMAHPPIETMEESFRKSISFDSPQDDVGSRECQLEVVDQESNHEVPTADSPQDSVPDENGFEHIDVYLTDIVSPSPKEDGEEEEEDDEEEEEGWAVAAPDEHSSVGMLNHASELIQEHTEDIHTEGASENASDMGEDLKEVCICEERVNVEDADGCSESDENASEDEITENIGEHVALDDVISSPISSKQSDDPCHVTPFTLKDADIAVASEGPDNYSTEMEHVTLLETVAETGLPKVVTEQVVSSEAALPDDEQCCPHPETSLPQDTVLGSCELLDQNEQLQLHSSSMMSATPDPTVNTGEIHELHEEPPNPCNSISTDIFADQLAPDSTDLPLPSISSFDWMLSGLMKKSLNVLPAPSSNINLQEISSSEDTEETPPLPPLPPVQWRATKLQTGSTSLFAKLGRPPRPKPPVKQLENENNSAPGETNQESENVQEIGWNNCFSSQKEMAQATTLCSETRTDLLPESDSQENNVQEGYKECDVQSSNLFCSSEVKCNTDVTSVGDDMHTFKPPELIVIPEEAWSELVDMKPILKQEEERKQQLINGVSDCSSIHTSGLPIEKTTVEHESSDQKEELSAADSNTTTDSEENKPNGLPCQDDIQNPDFSVQQEDKSNDMVRDFSSALEEELAKLPAHSVPELPRYPLLQVISHDRSMLRKAPTLVQPSSKLSDEKNTVLDQIKNKTFNLKPVVTKRPNVMGGPRTNLQVAAILERANAIHQAVADDDDEDSWSE
ncbi:unnamed protein product [Triticum turgidum subsp. durum]|uniref:Protein SCAR n=1 Tax=Triticum turgidum subsp. durum TaxID=4567 RepID=A0A9R0T508_TRITD|nr:unnamed protein product [Triticum turgidum subsp. durum]